MLGTPGVPDVEALPSYLILVVFCSYFTQTRCQLLSALPMCIDLSGGDVKLVVETVDVAEVMYVLLPANRLIAVPYIYGLNTTPLNERD